MNELRLEKLRKCKSLYDLSEKQVLPEKKQMSFTFDVLASLKEVLQSTLDCNQIIEHIRTFIESNYSSEWFSTEYEMKKERNQEIEKISRMAQYICDTVKEVISTDVAYKVQLPEAISVNGVEVEEINCNIDLIVRTKKDKVQLIKFMTGNTDYSYAARIPARKVENNPSLVCMQLCANEKYEDSFSSLFFLKGKDDKKGQLPPFEYKKGKNVLSLETKESLEHLSEILKMPVGSKGSLCSDCIYNSYCSIVPAYKFPFKPEQNDEANKAEQAPKKLSFTESQTKIINHKDGPMAAIAIPGAGKTKALVERVKKLIENGVSPNNILMLSFTRKACKEIEERLSKELGDKLPNIFTFHSFCMEIIRQNRKWFGKTKLLEEVDEYALIEEVLTTNADNGVVINNVSYNGLQLEHGLIRRCSEWFKDIEKYGENIFIERNPKLDVEGILKIYQSYRKIYSELHYVNYDEIVERVYAFLKERTDMLALYSRIYKYIMVDEYQDIDGIQAELVYLFQHPNIVVVGDDDQSIYRFRGGDNRYLLEFGERFNAPIVTMGDNFRSNDKIVSTYKSLICNGTSRISKDFVSHKDAKQAPCMVKSATKEMLVRYINNIAKKYQLGDIAIICRKNRVIADLTNYLKPYYRTASPKNRVIDDNVFLLIYHMMNLFYNQDDVHSFMFLARINNVELNIKKNQTIEEYIESINGVPFSSTKANSFYLDDFKENPQLSFLKKIFSSMRLLRYAMDLKSMLKQILEVWTEKSDHPVLDNLFDKIEERHIGYQNELFHYLSLLVKYSDSERIEYGYDPDAITILTAHESKGREFPVVLLWGFEDFKNEGEDADEERRVLYVALSRAENTLIIFENAAGNESTFFDDIKESVNMITTA